MKISNLVNPNTLVAVCCYQGDAHRVEHAFNLYTHHGCPVVVLSPENSPVTYASPGVESQYAGQVGYIGADTLTRQYEYLKILLTYPHEFFLINDSDSFCVSAEIPRKLYYESEDTLWSNMVVEPRPHASPYPKFAAQPPYFLARRSIEKILAVAGRVFCHPITPYVDWWMLAVACEAGLKLRPFTDLEHASVVEPWLGVCPWDQLAYRIKHMNATMMHPIKNPDQVALCVEARKYYERSQS